MRKAILNFIPSRNGAQPKQLHASFVAEDAQTPIGRKFLIADVDELEKIVDKLHGNGAHARTVIYNWGQGSEWVELSDEQCRYFDIK